MQKSVAADRDVEPAKYAHVHAVPVPKLLQAPFGFPPKYNFNRVAVYVLPGPSSSPRTPTAVVLRGTTRSHGPVEMTIPVQTLARPGETVHQLAAKKAVHGLWFGGLRLACVRQERRGRQAARGEVRRPFCRHGGAGGGPCWTSDHLVRAPSTAHRRPQCSILPFVREASIHRCRPEDPRCNSHASLSWPITQMPQASSASLQTI
ncbi:hypothetical protein MAPG_10011 [Magnaporthiopsis poae ATCC 64411]|uniref:Uncharacterized protein n=1 Tax=Magnaporthiopsis poae (strain ATCC 64411 / 73-15) TaxID=644358 RepID=A0A0C4EBG4_MAGP6|nr:hypothetical protein MAPG_10011 [Magnaporthiopsis poae ATCC 64411]